MQVLIVGDDQAVIPRIRQTLARHSHPSSRSRIVTWEQFQEESHPAESKPDLLVLLMSSTPEEFRPILAKAREAGAGHLVVIGDAREPDRILSAIHEGADDYLDEAGDLELQLEDFLNRVETTTESDSPYGRMTLVATANGGCGGSSTAVNLAVALAEENGDCALLDFVPRQGDLEALLDLKPRHTLADLCRNIENLDHKMFEQSLLTHDSGVRLLAAPRKFSEMAHVTVGGASRVARLAQTRFRDVVIDTDDVFQQSGTQLLEWSTRIVLLMRLDFASLRNAGRLLEHWREFDIPSEKVMLVANRAGQSRELSAATAEEVLQQKIAFSIPDDPKTANSCVNCGSPAVTESPRSRFAGVFREMAAAIDGTAVVQPAEFHEPSWAKACSLFERFGLRWMPPATLRLDKAIH